MPHGKTWLSFLPLSDDLHHMIEAYGRSWMFNNSVHVQHLLAIALVSMVMLLLALFARAGMSKGKVEGDILPDDKLTARNFVEILMEGVLTIMEFAMSRKAALKHFWLIGPLTFFILFSNLLGLIPGFLPPTENFNTTFACATIVFIYYNVYAFYKLGLSYPAHMANPVGEAWGWFLAPIFFPIELISHCVRPITLGVRLLCNMAGDHLVLAVFVGIFPLILPIPFMALGLFVALVQTLIFSMLSCVYLGEVEHMIEEHEHHHHGAEAGAAAH
ncbi:MAG: F0F1 ATP synthase subunit A [Myxococcota bacterium]